MVIIMNRECRKTEIGRVFGELRERGFEPRVIANHPRTVLGLVEDLDRTAADDLRRFISGMPGVAGVELFGTSWKLASREHREGRTVIRVGGRRIGGGRPVVIAGPCAVESGESLMKTAEAVAAAGASFLRGGAFKPRTSPYSFRGMGEEGLKLLADASRRTGLPFVTEVLSPAEVPLVAEYADVLQIGTRNMQNYALLEAAGEADRPVLLKRGLMATIKELLLAAEYILARGNPQVILCERGIRTFETETRNTLDISAVPLLRRLSHLPVIVDPSHAVGKRELVPSVSLAAIAAGADGLMIEVHHDPDNAVSDARQSLGLEDFARLMSFLAPVADAVQPFYTDDHDVL